MANEYLFVVLAIVYLILSYTLSFKGYQIQADWESSWCGKGSGTALQKEWGCL